MNNCQDEDQRIYRHKHPNDPAEIIVDVKIGGENRFEIQVVSRQAGTRQRMSLWLISKFASFPRGVLYAI